jgi:hypothetical protein
MGTQNVAVRNINTAPRALFELIPDPTSPAVRVPSTTPKPPGVKLKLLTVAPAP